MQEPQGVYLEGDGFGDDEDYGDEGDEEPVLAIENWTNNSITFIYTLYIYFNYKLSSDQ